MDGGEKMPQGGIVQALYAIQAWAFIAVMSSSRCDDVTQSVHVFVCVSLFVLLVWLEFYLLLKCFNVVSRIL